MRDLALRTLLGIGLCLGVLAFCVLPSGCGGSGRESQEREESNLKPLAVLYGQFIGRHRDQPPGSEEEFKAFIRSLWVLGIKEKGRRYYWRLLGWTLLKRPRSFAMSVTLAIYGFHFRKVVERYAKLPVQNNA